MPAAPMVPSILATAARFPASEGGEYETLIVADPNATIKVTVSCTCASYAFNFAHANVLAKFHAGEPLTGHSRVVNGKRIVEKFVKPKGKRPPRNPSNIPGVCKHIAALLELNPTLAKDVSKWLKRKAKS